MGKYSEDSNTDSEIESGSDFETEEEVQGDEYDDDANLENESGSESEMEEDVKGDESDEEEDDDDEENVQKNEVQKDAELEELEQEYQNLRDEEQDILKNLKSHKDEDIRKGQAVKNQTILWDKTLEHTILLHKVYSSSNKLPQKPLRASFLESDKAVNEAYSDLITSSEQTINCLLELQEVLLDKNPSIKISDGTKITSNLNVENDEEWLRIQQMQSRIAPWRDSSIDKWHRKTQVTTGEAGYKGKLQAFNQNISEQVAGYMRDPSKRIKAMQLRRSAVGIIGADYDAVCNKEVEEENMMDGDPELLDDFEFFHQLLRELLGSAVVTSDEALAKQQAKFNALKGQQNRKRKTVDRRASKNRKIRYNVHEALVNFMAPEHPNVPPTADIFKNLFGLKNQNHASVV
ncbi:hypothetical protein GIB67_040810 [Kingdonia uniflora]|uniref:Protein AATF n=1 Tax=Kingdonia uniflora TaxID=39325 RepID=A0A7J7P4E5_9MAGN|nr:hypothetical protein GIB67_040810 [Kingdonia uniflora]